MIDQALIDGTLRRLQSMNTPTLRRDWLVTVQMAQRCINDLLKGDISETRRLRYIAKQIADRAAVKPVMVFRTKKTGEIRWQAAGAKSSVRIPVEQVIGTYDHGADWRDILEDLR